MPASPKLSLRNSLRLARSPHKPPPPGVVVEGVGAEEDDDSGVPSIDAILARARPRVDKALRRRESEVVERERALLEAEKRAQEESRALREREITLNERERECSEREMLLDIRENNVAMRESLLANDGESDSPENGSASALRRYEDLRAKLESQERELRRLSEQLDRREEELRRREKTFESAEAGGNVQSNPADPDAAARLRELEEREKMLAEREAFIEQSENVLFNRAQELQELEAQLSHLGDVSEDGPARTPETAEKA